MPAPLLQGAARAVLAQQLGLCWNFGSDGIPRAPLLPPHGKTAAEVNANGVWLRGFVFPDPELWRSG